MKDQKDNPTSRRVEEREMSPAEVADAIAVLEAAIEPLNRDPQIFLLRPSHHPIRAVLA